MTEDEEQEIIDWLIFGIYCTKDGERISPVDVLVGTKSELYMTTDTDYEDWLDSLGIEASYLHQDTWHEEMSCAKEEDNSPGQDSRGEEEET